MKLKHCTLADADHRRERRYYAHVLHRPDCICICKAFANLPDEHAYAILLHELGHLIDVGEEDELAVDKLAAEKFNIPIRRVSSRYGRNLEYIEPKYVARAERVLAKKVK
jgi:hypothetical protein